MEGLSKKVLTWLCGMLIVIIGFFMGTFISNTNEKLDKIQNNQAKILSIETDVCELKDCAVEMRNGVAKNKEKLSNIEGQLNILIKRKDD